MSLFILVTLNHHQVTDRLFGQFPFKKFPLALLLLRLSSYSMLNPDIFGAILIFCFWPSLFSLPVHHARCKPYPRPLLRATCPAKGILHFLLCFGNIHQYIPLCRQMLLLKLS